MQRKLAPHISLSKVYKPPKCSRHVIIRVINMGHLVNMGIPWQESPPNIAKLHKLLATRLTHFENMFCCRFQRKTIVGFSL